MGSDTGQFHIVHLSDLHLTTKDGMRRSSLKLWGELRTMNASFRKLVHTPLLQQSNLILVTGDVTDTGELASWQVFWGALEKAGLKDRVLVVPGNHDVCCLNILRPDSAGYAKEDLEKAVNGLKCGNQPTTFPWASVPDPRVVIFGLNSNNLGNFSGLTNALGNLDFYQLEAFARLLHTHKDVPVKIVALHHSPNIPSPATAKKRGLAYTKLTQEGFQIPQDERRALRLLSLSHGVRVILHGHLHQQEDRRVNGIRIIGVPASTEPVRVNRKAGLLINSYIVSSTGKRLEYRSDTIAC